MWRILKCLLRTLFLTSVPTDRTWERDKINHVSSWCMVLLGMDCFPISWQCTTGTLPSMTVCGRNSSIKALQKWEWQSQNILKSRRVCDMMEENTYAWDVSCTISGSCNPPSLAWWSSWVGLHSVEACCVSNMVWKHVALVKRIRVRRSPWRFLTGKICIVSVSFFPNGSYSSVLERGEGHRLKYDSMMTQHCDWKRNGYRRSRIGTSSS